MSFIIRSENCDLSIPMRGEVGEELEKALVQEPLISSIHLFIRQRADKTYQVNMDVHCWHKDFHSAKSGVDLASLVRDSQRRLLLEIRANKKENFKLRKRVA